MSSNSPAGSQVNKLIGVYEMRYQKPRGMLLVANNHDGREGAEKDDPELKEVFERLGFEVFIVEQKDLKKDALLARLDQILAECSKLKVSCFIMAVMSHGNDDYFELREDTEIMEHEIVERVCDETSLHGKPKIFLFNHCRGNEFDKCPSAKREASALQSDNCRKEKCFRDTLVANSSTKGFASVRKHGTWYMQAFCRNVAAHAQDVHFEDILKMTQHEVSKQSGIYNKEEVIQMPSYRSYRFNKRLYLNPEKCS